MVLLRGVSTQRGVGLTSTAAALVGVGAPSVAPARRRVPPAIFCAGRYVAYSTSPNPVAGVIRRPSTSSARTQAPAHHHNAYSGDYRLPAVSSKRGLQSAFNSFGAADEPAAAAPEMGALATQATADAHLRLRWDDGAESSFHYSWLLDNCPCPFCKTASGQKLSVNARNQVRTAAAPRVTLLDGGRTVRLHWHEKHANVLAETHVSEFPASWLDEHCYSRPERVAARRFALPPTPWGSELQGALPVVDCADVMQTDAGLLECSRHLQKHGLVFVRNTPAEEESVERAALRFGQLRDTFYGRTWDVTSVPQAVNIAYTSVELGFHQDLFYFESPPGLQLLHCVEYSIREGGASLFLDGFKALDVLRAERPDAYETLATVPVTYHYRHGRQRRQLRRTIVDRRADNDMDQHVGIYFSPQFEGPLDVPFDQVDRFYDAYRHLLAITQRRELHVATLLQPGDLVIFNNRRLFHARTGFDASTGRRRLRGCYVDLDDYMSTLRELEERAAAGTLDAGCA